MSTSKQRVLVLGYGNAGSHILRSLAAQPQHFETSLLVKPSSLSDPSKQSTLDSFRALGIPLIPGDIRASEAELVLLLSGFDVVICVVSHDLVLTQIPLAHAAIKAGIRRFVPCEFGLDVGRINKDSILQPIAAPKVQARQSIIASGVPYTLIECSVWTDFMVHHIRAFDFDHRVLHVPLSLDTRLSTTTWRDVGELTAAIIRREDTINQDLHVASETLTFGQLAEALERATGEKWERRVVSAEEAQAAHKANPTNFLLMFMVMLTEGKGYAWSEAETWNFQHPETRVNVTSMEAFFREVEAQRKAAK